MSENRTVGDDELEARLRGALHEIGDDALRTLGANASSQGVSVPQSRTRRSTAPLVATAAVVALVGSAALSPRLFDVERDRRLAGEGPTTSSSGSPSPLAGPDIRSAVDRVSARATRHWRDSGYGRVTVDYEAATVRVYWHGSPPPEIEKLDNGTIDGVEVDIIDVPYSDSDMSAAGRRVLNHSGTSAEAVTVSHTFPSKDFSALVVVVLKTDDTLDAAGLEKSLAKVAGMPVIVKVTKHEWVGGPVRPWGQK